ncbi:MAG: methionine adenosyltransferase [Sulfobacillus sp.]
MAQLITSESVTEGHPDKIADQISDGILDALLAQDPDSRVACETLVTTGLVLVSGEITTEAYVDVPRLCREIIRDIGYTRAKYGFDADTCAVLTSIHDQSQDIAHGVGRSVETRQGGDQDLGAGDQGMVVGFACDETTELMPLPIFLAHRLAERLAEVRKSQLLPFVLPDGKTQVTVSYQDGVVQGVETVVVSTQHKSGVSNDDIGEQIRQHVIDPVLPTELVGDHTRVLVNPSGRFVLGGPHADTGLTGRKIIVDSYGGVAHHGGGAFSGKDPTKVDRSGAYAARWAAKHVVSAGLARRCEIQIAYAIGVARPVAVHIDTFGTGLLPDAQLAQAVAQVFDFRPAAIIEALDLRRPIYRQTASYGHFGRPGADFPWERLDRLADMKKAAAVYR